MTSEYPANETPRYGHGDTTFKSVGGEAGVRRLVDDFYDIMSTTPEYQRIFRWHPDGDEAREKLARFLCGWMGGPKRYHEKYGAISIPGVHAHLAITAVERDMWLGCMTDALARQPYPEALKKYLIEQLAVPAEAVRRRCEAGRSSGAG